MKGKCLITKSFKVQVFTTTRHYETALLNHVLGLGIYSNVMLQLLQKPPLSSSIAVLHVFVYHIANKSEGCMKHRGLPVQTHTLIKIISSI
jgi:hypothetical protein